MGAYLANMPKIQFVYCTDIFDYDETRVYQQTCFIHRDVSHFSACSERFVANTYRGGIF